jgi:hypothetical protein
MFLLLLIRGFKDIFMPFSKVYRYNIKKKSAKVTIRIAVFPVLCCMIETVVGFECEIKKLSQFASFLCGSSSE